jgi:GH15 family glucan-1,4-alpha-glucosidase
MTDDRIDGYLPIERYAAIGDGRTVALVGDDGRIDWWPVTAVDAPPSFAALLDQERGGHIALAPTGSFRASRRYLPDTNVLETEFTTDTGVVRVTDLLPVGKNGRLPWAELTRRIEGISGHVELAWKIAPGTQFGDAKPWVDTHHDSLLIHVGDETLALRLYDIGAPVVDSGAVSGRFVATAGSTGLLAILGANAAPAFFAERDELEKHIDLTVDRWQQWSTSIDYDGPWPDAVRRSGLMLKLLQYAPTGAVVAAPTSSLPERIGGSKNWDYRFMWVRDSAFTIDALLTLGLHDEAQAAVQWLLGTLRETAPDLHVFYTVGGGRPARERKVDLSGYRDSAPVRAGNGAARQTQLSTFGDLFETIWQYVDDGHRLDLGSSQLLADLADRCCDMWQSEDSSIWELHEQRHYTVSKIGCWTALDRAVRLHQTGQVPTDHVARWERERDGIKAWVDAHCWSAAKNSYTFYAGTDDLDAATLLAARTGFDISDRLRGTVKAIQAELSDGPLIYRYTGAAEQEGAFLACSFWLVNALVLLGDIEQARDAMNQALAVQNDVGLLAEQLDPASGAMLGNFPQGLSHLALINAACAYHSATGGDPEDP